MQQIKREAKLLKENKVIEMIKENKINFQICKE